MKLKLSTIALIVSNFCVLLGICLGFGFKAATANYQAYQRVAKKLNRHTDTALAEQRKKLNKRAKHDQARLSSRINDKNSQIVDKDKQIKVLNKKNEQLSQQKAPKDSNQQSGSNLTAGQKIVLKYYQKKYGANNVTVIPVKKIGIENYTEDDLFGADKTKPRVSWIDINDPYTGRINCINYAYTGSVSSTTMPMNEHDFYDILTRDVNRCKQTIATHNPQLNGKHVIMLVSRSKSETDGFLSDCSAWRLRIVTLKYLP